MTTAAEYLSFVYLYLEDTEVQSVPNIRHELVTSRVRMYSR